MEFHKAKIPLPDEMKTIIGKVLAYKKVCIYKRMAIAKDDAQWQLKGYKDITRIEKYEDMLK
jgi:hypothetical protein